MSSPLVVGIAGGTASGKTTVARKVREALADCRVAFIDQDSYYRDLKDMSLVDRREVNFDHPDAFDTELLVSHLRALKQGQAIQKPVYDFVTSGRQAHTHRVDPGDIVLIEGILVLHMKEVRDEMDVKIYVDADDDLRILRRLTRDIKDRGRDFDHVVGQYLRHVRPMHMGFVEPSKHHADIIIPHGGNNDIAIGMLVGALRARLASQHQSQR
ncbi:uridine kinase [Corallococcus exiguus]|uniref:uridine kinase n=1 Tax=Corallococcus TaxID=83461 RepID=UPI000EE2BA81|nr:MULTISPECIES: uridine kinase [Corallococcus]NNB90476.1 uridine kinase [Corallococcus exiguus]NNB99108.1 uridine kinase [Corallococcus exiguus]NNC07836.1 uridine kinase [Corallococcus exiguus]NPC50942.1 uridine kinase [Corallococcus exiguus]RKH79190.1 uridine kinase [Corallococcus sp. AB032C]